MGQDDERSSEASRPPVSDREFRSFLNKVNIKDKSDDSDHVIMKVIL